MNATQARAYAARLEATGLQYHRAERDGSGNTVRLEAVPWETVLGIVLAKTGMRLVDLREMEPRGAEIEVMR